MLRVNPALKPPANSWGLLGVVIDKQTWGGQLVGQHACVCQSARVVINDLGSQHGPPLEQGKTRLIATHIGLVSFDSRSTPSDLANVSAP